MPNNPPKILLSITLVGGILISISSNSWLGAWLGLEVNLMSIIPLMSSSKNIYTTEASLKYFIIQALASSTLLFLVMMKTMISQSLPLSKELFENAIMMPLFTKMGAAPLHWWFPSVMEGLSWSNCLLMMTVQKAAPMMLTSYLMSINALTLIIILTSVTVGALGGMNQTSLRKILTYSSINHTGWMITAMAGGNNLWILYFLVYSLLTTTMTTITKTFNISFINQVMTANSKTTVKFLLFTTLLSLGGLPPFIGFLPKWAVIQMMISNSLMTFVMTTMVIMSLATLYYYLRMCYSSFLILHSEVKWNSWPHREHTVMTYSTMLATTSMVGLVMCTMITNLT
uniref:NADH-ubiquinone oxidoreductase chain 2 n=1 Tax=Kalotermitidae sp. 4 AB-2022a TaxID=2942736 RepID=A0A8X8M2F6_9NEOP|nr:NADH dehydrogenase subunit 2 [Kalotermitidae sp. 4 AB-2022a]